MVLSDLTATEFRDALNRLGLTMAAAAKRWQVPYRTIQNWSGGLRKPPPILDHLVALEEGEAKPLKERT